MTHEYSFLINSPYHGFNFDYWDPGQYKSDHSHNFLQFIHVISGYFEVDFGAGWQQVSPGCVHVLPPGCVHSLKTTTGHSQFGLSIISHPDERGWHGRLYELFKKPGIFPLPFQFPQRLIKECQSNVYDDTTQLRLINIFDQYCLELYTSLQQHSHSKAKKDLFLILNQNINNNLSVDEIALKMNMSRASLQRFCAKNYNCGAHALYQQIRVDRAARLLIQSDISVGECAIECGYDDIYSFSRIFKRLKGYSPKNYVKQFKSE